MLQTGMSKTSQQHRRTSEMIKLEATPAETPSADSDSSSAQQSIRHGRTSVPSEQQANSGTGAQMNLQLAAIAQVANASTAAAIAVNASTSGGAKLHLARAKSITGKLSESHGAELRRALFSLKQLFQEDAPLASAFIEANGLDCLLKVARDADQIHQNYILRAIGQLVTHPGGMAALLRHNETLQWLYAQLASEHQLVVKSSLKLLLKFVEQSDAHAASEQLLEAFRVVDRSKGLNDWSNVINLFKTLNKNNNNNKNHQVDWENLTNSLGLINLTLDHLHSDSNGATQRGNLINSLDKSNLKQLIMDRYSDLDSQLRKQFKLYEQKLASAEEDDDNNNDDQEIDDDNEDDEHEGQNRSDETVKTSIMNGTRTCRDLTGDSGSTQSAREISANRLSPAVAGSSSNTRIMRSVEPLEATSGAGPQNDDNDYESANDDSNQDDVKQPSNHTSDGSTSRTINTRATNRLVQTLNEDHQREHPNGNGNRVHQLLLRSQPTSLNQRNSSHVKQQNNLARGKQQRASISSCSSSDSYASYGSGYASGSGNSTDHEHKQQERLDQQQQQHQQLQQQQLQSSQQQQMSMTTQNQSSDHRGANALNALTAEINNLSVRSATRRVKICEGREEAAKSSEKDQGEEAVSDEDTESDVGDTGAKVDEREDGDGASDENSLELKQHLSELEQLTDELSKRDSYTSLKQPTQLVNRKNPSPNLRPSFTKASSVLSTDSYNSSLSSGINATTSSQQQQQQQQQAMTTGIYQIKSPTSNTTSSGHADVDPRSTSATPTSCQPQQAKTASPQQQTAVTSTPIRQYAQTGLDSRNELAHKNLTRPVAGQYAMPSSANVSPSSRIVQAAKSSLGPASPSSKTQPQDSYYHNLFQWEQLVSRGVTRPLLINDLDFTDLRDEDDCDLLNSNNNQGASPSNARTGARILPSGEPLTISIPSTQQGQPNLDHDSVDSGTSTGSPGPRSTNEQTGAQAGVPPPLPPPPISPWFNTVAGSRPQSQFMSTPSPPPFDFGTASANRDQSPAASTYSAQSRNSIYAPQGSGGAQQFGTLQSASSLRSASSMSSLLFGNNGKYANKRKKTMKLFWKEVREDRSLLAKLTKKKTIWDEIKPVNVDTQRLEYLFESKAKDLSLSKSRTGLDALNQRKVKITVLDAKRSNAINIGMTKLPPMRTIKSAILKMDSSIMNREGIEKILTTMMPTEEEKSRIIEAQLANPDTPLGTAEQFLLNLASISALEARLKLWAFQLDYAQIEKEVAEPLMDLKQAIEEIERSETFRNILGILLSIGNFLNSTNAKGFQIDYLEKVPEVKDTVHKHSLLHHLCLFIQEKFDPELSSDLYSEFSAVNRASKVDYTEVAKNLKKMQQDCKSSWDHLKIVAKHDGLANLMNPCAASIQGPSESSQAQHQPKTAGKLNNLSKLSMITTVIGSESSSSDQQQATTTKQMKIKVSDFLTDCAERIMVLMVIHRRVMNRFQKLLVYLGCPSHQIKQTQPQQILKIINEFALEYRTKRERVREMLMRKHQCQHHHHHGHGNRWQLNRTRWAGSQQSVDGLGYNNRPCSTASSISSFSPANNVVNCPECALSARHRSVEPRHHASRHGASHRPGSPSGLSQISNYSDYLLDQSCCSRQESITPVPATNGINSRPYSISVSMYDLQQRQNCHDPSMTKASTPKGNKDLDENEMARQKDEQMRRLLGGGKSLDGACHDLYQMSHWSSTMARITRHPPISNKQRASSIDTPSGKPENGERENSFDASFCTNDSVSPRRQSSYYRYLHTNGNTSCHIDDEQNSDEEILQSLVRTATTKSNHQHHNQNGSHSNRSSLASNCDDSTNSNDSAASIRSAKTKILSRFNCDRKSCKYYCLALAGFFMHLMMVELFGL